MNFRGFKDFATSNPLFINEVPNLSENDRIRSQCLCNRWPKTFFIIQRKSFYTALQQALTGSNATADGERENTIK